MRKLRDFQSFVYSLSLHIIAITETWLSPSIFDGEILSTGFTLYHKDRKTRGGGVLLAIHHSLPSLQLQSPPDLEVVTVQIMTRGTPLICIVYVPPNSDNNYCLAIVDYLNSISANHQILILGDFNSPDICWSTLTGHSSSSRALSDLLFRHNLSQLVDFLTHVSGSTLDLIIRSPGFNVTDLKILPLSTLQSDHHMLGFSLPLLNHSAHATSSLSRVSLDYRQADFDAISSFLLDYDFSSYYKSYDIQFLWGYLKDTILSSISLFTPAVKKRSHCYPQ